MNEEQQLTAAKQVRKEKRKTGFGNGAPFLGRLNDFLFTFLSHISVHIPDLDKKSFIFLLSNVL